MNKLQEIFSCRALFGEVSGSGTKIKKEEWVLTLTVGIIGSDPNCYL